MKILRRLASLVVAVMFLMGMCINDCYAYTDFGIRSPDDMPKIKGCRDVFDEELYYGGIAAGVDPVLLKVIMSKESGGNPDVEDNVNKHKDGSTSRDIGIMQINDRTARGLGVTDMDELRRNHVFNIWAATEVIKGKYAFVKSVKGKRIAGETVRLDSLSILWGYNGFSSRGLGYAKTASKRYSGLTKLKKVRRGSLALSDIERFIIREALAKSADDFGVVRADDVVTDSKMTYEEFSDRLEDISKGKLVPRKVDIDMSKRKSVKEIIRDETLATGIANDNAPEDVLLNYKVYNFVKCLVKVIYWVIVALSYVLVILVALLWVGYILSNVGINFVSNFYFKVSKGRLDFTDEGSFRKIFYITIFALVMIAMSISGITTYMMERIIIRIVTFFG